MSLASLAARLTVGQADDQDNDSGSRSAVDDADDPLINTQDLLGTGGRVLLILFLAIIAHIVLRRAIMRFARRLANSASTERLSRIRSRAPAAVAQSSVFAERATARAQTLAQVLRSVATAVIWTIALVTILGELGVNLGPIIAGAGIAGVALGFGAQSLVKDFLTGFFMLVEDQLGVGDIVDLGDATGTVEAVTLRITRVRDIEGVVWHVPNGQIERVANLSQDWSRALLDVSVSYDTSPDRASAVIKQTADELRNDPKWARYILGEPEVWGVQDLGPDAIIIRLVVKTVPAEQWPVMRELRRRLWVAFEEEQIEIPFPQRTVWHRGEPPTGGYRTEKGAGTDS